MYQIINYREHKQANTYIVNTDNNISMYSYCTLIAYYNKNDNLITFTGLYSRTTIKHIGWFCKSVLDNTITYSDVKTALNNNFGIIEVCEATKQAIIKNINNTYKFIIK